MSDLIDRQTAIDAVNVGNLHRGIVDALQSIISDLPSAQPQRKEGRWINHLGLPLNDFCSVCTKDSPYNKHWNYCPNCGARMKGEDNE